MRILIAEDERLTRTKLRRQLEQLGHDVVDAPDGQQAWELFKSEPFPIVISDWEMPVMNGVDLVRRIRDSDTANYVYIVMLTGKSEKKDVVEGIEAGADDFVSKPFDKDELRARLSAGQRIVELEHNLAAANNRLRHELAVARELSDVEHKRHEESLLGNSIAVRALREGIQVYAANDAPLMLCGPTGAGQEAVARSIHRNSVRRSRAFIYVACPHVSIANESIYGFEFNPDRQGRSGKAALAHGGTLFLEGIETLSEAAQSMLAKFLRESAEKRDAGESFEPDVRVISHVTAETDDDHPLSGDLRVLLEQQRLSVPPLAERQDDINVIAKRILDRRAISAGKALEGLSTDAKTMLERYSWPGNIRELHSVLERAILLSSRTLLDIPEELLREGRRVGGYTLQRRLGEGGMGEVWLAQHSLLARPSAVKLIRHSSLRKDAGTREMLEERFEREAKATALLRSPHTVELYDFGVTDEGDFFYVMEYLIGVDLHSLVAKFGPISPARAIFLLKQAAISLGEAHGTGLVHRDIKPANLFVCQLGNQFDFLKLLDFGIVRTSSGTDQTQSSSGVIKGSPTSMAPEAVKGEEVSAAADIYGLGCVAYWLLTGRQVFDAPNVMAMLLKHASKKPDPPSVHCPNLPKEIDDLVLCCLAKKPADRPADANELSDLLESIPLDQDWGNDDAKSWWEASLPSIGEVFSSSDTSVEMRPDTKPVLISDHPEETDLAKWSRGELAPIHAAAIEEHLGICDDCGEKVDSVMVSSVKDDAFTGRVRDLLQEDDIAQTVDVKSPTPDQFKTDHSADNPGSEIQLSFAGNAIGASQSEWIGRKLGEFEVTELIGVSENGLVLKALDKSIGRYVAIKVLSDELAEDKVAMKRFLAEAQSVGKLDHVNTVRLHEVVQDGSLCYLVMEYVGGCSTRALVDRNGAFSPIDATEIVVKACRGLSAVHQAGLIHRDIKPSKLIIGQDGTVKVSGFGLSKESDSKVRQLTIAGQVIGTPSYMSPEQCESGLVDSRSDIYSLGATYYTLLTGKRPFESDDPIQVMMMQRNDPSPDPRDTNPSIPEVCSQIIEQAMAKRPSQRYQSMDEFLSDLEAVMATVSGLRVD